MLAGWSPARATYQVGQLQGGPDGLLLPGLYAGCSELIDLCLSGVMLADSVGLPPTLKADTPLLANSAEIPSIEDNT